MYISSQMNIHFLTFDALMEMCVMNVLIKLTDIFCHLLTNQLQF